MCLSGEVTTCSSSTKISKMIFYVKYFWSYWNTLYDIPEEQYLRKEVENSIKKVEPLVIKLKQTSADLKRREQQKEQETIFRKKQEQHVLHKVKLEKEI